MLNKSLPTGQVGLFTAMIRRIGNTCGFNRRSSKEVLAIKKNSNFKNEKVFNNKANVKLLKTILCLK